MLLLLGLVTPDILNISFDLNLMGFHEFVVSRADFLAMHSHSLFIYQ